jgi:electron transfer DM13
MSNRLKVSLLVLVLAGVAGWYAFRPERLFINQKVNEQFPTASAASSNQVATGQFHSGAHETKGVASVFQLGNGTKTLRLTNFATSNGPDVHVYLVAATDAKDNDAVTNAGFIDLGSLKGNIGDQNYELPANADLAKYRAVTIWCKRFSVNFGTAPLMPMMAASMQPANMQ